MPFTYCASKHPKLLLLTVQLCKPRAVEGQDWFYFNFIILESDQEEQSI